MKDNSRAKPAESAEHETSPDTPYNPKQTRHFGTKANRRPNAREWCDIERQKQYYHSGKRPSLAILGECRGAGRGFRFQNDLGTERCGSGCTHQGPAVHG